MGFKKRISSRNLSLTVVRNTRSRKSSNGARVTRNDTLNQGYKRAQLAIKRARTTRFAKNGKHFEEAKAKPDLWNEIDSFVEVKDEEVDEIELNVQEEEDHFISPSETLESDPFSEETRCLICFHHDPDPLPLKGLLPKFRKLVIPDKLEDDLRIIHLLKMIFQWTTTELEYLMKHSNGQSPREWIHLCHSCRLLIFEIQTLEDRMRDCRKRINDKIMATVEMSSSVPVSGRTLMTRRIRDLVNQQKRSARENTLFIDGDRQAEQLVKFKMSGNTSEPIVGSSIFIDGGQEAGASVQLENQKMGYEQFLCADSLNDFSDEDMDIDINQSENLPEERTHPLNRLKLKRSLLSTSTEIPLVKVTKYVKKKEKKAQTLPKATKYACLTCPSLMKMNLNAFIAHLIFHWRRPIRCTVCMSHLPCVPEAIDGHWQQHHPDLNSSTEVKFEPVQCSVGNVFRCWKCPMKFASFQERNEHEQLRHKESLLKTEKCSVCEECFMNTEEVRLHRGIDHPEVASVACYYCEQVFPVESVEGVQYLDCEALKQHCLEKEDHPKEDGRIYHLHACDLCGHVVKDNTNKAYRLKTHLNRKHSLEGKLRFSCFICHKDVLYSNKWRHFAIKHAKNTICDTCGQEMRPGALPTHNLLRHDILMDGFTKYSCQEGGCDYQTVHAKNLLLHASVKHNSERERKHKCSSCDKAFFTQQSLAVHEERHQNKETKPYQCEICGSQYACSRDLYLHNRFSHLNMKPLSAPKLIQCEHCPYFTKRGSDLKRHMELWHSDSSKNKGAKKILCLFGCSVYLANLTKFDEHLANDHSMELEKEEHIFHSLEGFQTWRNALKERHSFCYTKYSENNGIKIFLCNRSSMHTRRSKGQNLRKKKSILSDKVCRSRIILKSESDGNGAKWKVTFLKTHTGHDIEHGKVGLSDALKWKIAEDIMNGATKKQILDHLRDGGGDYGGVTRGHLINRQDIDNICKKFNLTAEFDVRKTPSKKRKKCK